MRWPWSRRRTFDSPPKPIDMLFLEMARASGTTVTRSEALSVPAVRRGRNEICAIATMPLEEIGPDNQVKASALLGQIDPDVPNVVTIAQTIEDLLFEAISWWLVTATDFAGFPISARHLDVTKVSVNPPAGQNPSPLPAGVDPRRGVIWVDGKPVSGSRIIRFDSPNPAVLHHSGREIRRAILLDKAAGMYADDPRPLDYFTPADGADPVDDDEVEQILAKWKAARKQRSTAYVPAAMAYNTVDAPSPQQLQLAELGRQASLDIANSMGIDPEDLGISTTSRTYANDVDRRRNKLNEVLSPYMRAITDRLSMGDVTRKGATVRFNTTEYLLPNPVDRWQIYSTAEGMGAMTINEIREAEGRPPLPDDPPPEPVEVDPPAAGDDEEDGQEVEQVDATRAPAHTFDESRELTFVDVPVTGFTVDRGGRVIEGVALPYGQVAQKHGLKFRFERGALQWDADNPGWVKLLRDHDASQPLGKAIQLRDTPRGVLARFKVARGAAGDEALELAEDGVLDGLSVGVDFDMATDTVPDPKDRTTVLVRRADWRETSLTALPSFDKARVTKVAASRTTGGGPVADTDTTVVEPDTPATDSPAEPAGLTLTQDQLTVLLSQPGALQALTRPAAAPEPETPAGGLTLTAEQVQALIASGGLGTLLGIPTLPAAQPDPDPERPTPVDPTRSLNLAVTSEALPYRFDRRGPNGATFVKAEHEFSTDLHDMALARDMYGTETDAGKRVMALLHAMFADTDTADVTSLNPAIQRPDMYVDQRDFRYPIWEAISRGAPPNGVQPFTFPKFATASGLVGDHTQGTEPTGGTFTTTSQTVTPTAISGKASITREVWDMGGNPAVSTLIFNQMLRGWREGLESAAATFLNTLTAATDIALGVAPTDQALADAWDQALAGLQFVRGYDYSVFAVEQVLYKAFVGASDSTGRPLFPIIGPTNANGQATTRFRQLDLSGVIGSPSWALPSTPGSLNNSWLFDPSTVWGWASTPQRLEFPGSGGAAGGVEYKPVAHVDLAIWGYKALANTDIEGVRQVTYDSVAP